MKIKNKKATLAITQSLILILSIIAIAFMVGSSVEVVSASDNLCAGQKDGFDCGDNSVCQNEICVSECVFKYAGATCADVTTNTCSVSFKQGDCPGAVNIQCCSGTLTPKEKVEEINTKETPTLANTATDTDNLIEGGDVTYYTAEEVNRILGEQGATTLDREAINSELTSSGKTKFSMNDISSAMSAIGMAESAKNKITGALKGLKETSPPGTKPGVSKPGWVSTYFLGKGDGFLVTVGSEGMSMGTYIFSSYAVAFAAAQLFIFIAQSLGAGDRNMQGIKTTAYTAAAVAATAATVVAVAASAGPPGWIVAAAVIVVTAIYMAFSYQDYSQEMFSYKPQVWQPGDGGSFCEGCNDFRYGCSEYQCHSLGKSCGIINKGTADETCTWINERDFLPPELKPLESALKSDKYKYVKSDAVLPGETGVKIIYDQNGEGCVPAFSSISFGVETNEPAECMIDLERKPNMSLMLGHMAEGPVSVYNHTIEIPAAGLPSQEALTASGFDIANGKNYDFFIRCKDTNGNPTIANFLMEFCVQDGPDTMAPIIEGTNYLPNTYISYNVSKAPLEVYTNEPADCRWDFMDLDYDQMEYGMDDCSQNMGDYLNSQTFQYGCTGEITGIKNGVPNDYYIKCEDKPWWKEGDLGKRFANNQPHILTLIGTEPLLIDEITINNKENDALIIDSVDPTKVVLEVKTSAGANEGNAICQYEISDTFYNFYNDGNFDYTYLNTQKLFLTRGEYNYTIKCMDKAGNMAEDFAIFEVDIDTQDPTITRIYYENENLKIKTNEDAVCVYSITECNYPFEDGAVMKSDTGFEHYVEWNTNFNLFIKCEDLFGNKPLAQDQCSMIARAVDREFY